MTLTERIESMGCSSTDIEGLTRLLDGRDNWGKMIHAVQYLTVLGCALDHMKEEAKQ